MTYIRTVKIPNEPGWFAEVEIYKCNGCEKEIWDCNPHIQTDLSEFCPECAFRLRLVDHTFYAQSSGVYLSKLKACFTPDGDIEYRTHKEAKVALKRPGLTKSKRFAILERDKFRCKYCGSTPDEKELHIDHINPKSLGGTDDAKNLVTACSDCNIGKSASLLTKVKMEGASL